MYWGLLHTAAIACSRHGSTRQDGQHMLTEPWPITALVLHHHHDDLHHLPDHRGQILIRLDRIKKARRPCCSIARWCAPPYSLAHEGNRQGNAQALFVIEHPAPRGRFWGEDWGKSFALLDHEGHDEVFVFGITPVRLHHSVSFCLRSCTSPLRIIVSPRKPGKMPPDHPIVRGLFA